MTRFAAFLRAVNVGGRTVTKEQLLTVFEALGLGRVETFIASGNVVFSSRSTRPGDLESRIETALHRALGFEVKTFIRTEAEVAAIAGYQAFPAKRLREARAFLVAFLPAALPAAAQRTLLDHRSEVDEFHVNGREAYWLCRAVKQSESPFFKVGFDRALKVPTTARSITTIRRLVEKYRFEETGT